MVTSRSTHDLLQSPWLVRLRKDLLIITTPAAQELWPSRNPTAPYFNYRYEHVRQVERLSLRLQQEPAADTEVLLAAVWLHDRFQPAFSGEEHGRRAALWARDNLPGLGFPPGKTDLVCQCVERHSSPFGQLASEPIEPLVLWDADKLAHLGVVGVMLHLLNRLASDSVEERETHPEYQRQHSALADIWTEESVNEFLRKRGNWKRFYLPQSREIAERFVEDQTACLQSLLYEMADEVVSSNRIDPESRA